MAFSRQTEAFIKNFVKDLLDTNVAIFAGAGMSKSAGYVDWPELLREIADELGLEVEKEHDLISLAQYHVNSKQSSHGLSRKILEEFSSQAEPTENHRILARLPIQTYWTTNYDTLIEECLKASFKIVDVKSKISQLSNTRPKRDAVLYKMHGDVQDPENAILYKQQYEKYYLTHESFVTALSGDLISKTFLFIGFSFTDPNLDYVLSLLHVNIQGTSEGRQHYCFMKKEIGQAGHNDDVKQYLARKQTLRIEDLKRYRIQAVLVDEYSEITEILSEIELRFRKRTVFVSGSAEEFGDWVRQKALDFVHSLTGLLITENFRVVNGFGWGIGSAVINGALQAIYSKPEKYSEYQLVMRPFPQTPSNNQNLGELWEEYRQRMITMAGIVIFVFGCQRRWKNVPDGGVKLYQPG